jgi:hypothetical protein
MPYRVKFAHVEETITLNLDDIFKIAIGGKLTKLDGLTGREAYHELWPAVAMIYRPDEQDMYKKLEPKGWGTLKEAQHFLTDMLELVALNPDEKFTVIEDVPVSKDQSQAAGANAQQSASNNDNHNLAVQ